MKKTRVIKPGGIVEYIAKCPKEAQANLKAIRAAIREMAPDAIETLSYFDMPGYSYEGYVYNGMFAWFSFKKPFVRVHIRPLAIEKYKKELEKYTTTKAVVSFPIDKPIPKTLVKKLVKASLKDMIDVSQ
jgi:uncharacterized protein YdhG (YjbR/CyaY superfamily)